MAKKTGEVTVIKCQLADYYRTGVRIEPCLRVLQAIRKGTTQKVVGLKPWQIAEFKKNLWVLGFLEGTGAGEITARGLSFLFSHALSERKCVSTLVSRLVARYVLLKAVADLDWECFSKLLLEHYMNKVPSSVIRARFFPYDTAGNFSQRWGFHKTIIEETGLQHILDKASVQNKMRFLAKLDPYASQFDGQQFFELDLRPPNSDEVRRTFLDAVDFFLPLDKDNDPIHSSEALKTVVHGLLLAEGLFCTEPILSRVLVDVSIKQRITLYRTSEDLRVSGRGFYRKRDSSYVYYPFFSRLTSL